MNLPSPAPDRRPRLLIVDDEPKNLRLLADIFADDYQLSVATSGRQALQLLDITPEIDLILLDLMMPGMDGREVYLAVRSRPNLQDLPVIFITARDDPDSEILALGSGAADYLHKPLHVGLTRARVMQQLTLARQRRELRVAREAADAGNRAKSQFLTGISHELRTPLNAILGFSQVLQHDVNLNPEQQAGITEIRDAGEHLLSLINDLLDLGKIEASRMALMPQRVPLIDLADACIRLLEPLAQRRGVTLLLEMAEEAPQHAWADPLRLRQVLVNLVSNAIKFTHERTTVRLRIRHTSPAPPLPGRIGRTPRTVCIEVRDEGPGIAPELRGKLFEPFERGIGRYIEQTEGTGIGLMISRRLIDLMGGEINFLSESGQGTSFWFTLPTEPADAAVLPTSGSAPGPVSEPDPGPGPATPLPATPLPATPSPARPGLQTALAHSEAEAPGALKAHTILCVDDNAANLKLLELMLRRRAATTVVTTREPRQALALASVHRPSLILLDIQMPEIDGYEVLRRLKAVPMLATIPVVALSANATAEDLSAGREAGFADYITKPFDMGRLLGAVDALI